MQRFISFWKLRVDMQNMSELLQWEREKKKNWYKKVTHSGASLVVQWLGVRLSMQGTWVRAPVWEDPIHHRVAKPMHHSCWFCVLEPASHNYCALMPQLLKPTHPEPVLCNGRGHCNGGPAHHDEGWAPLTTTGGSPCSAMKIQRCQK